MTTELKNREPSFPAPWHAGDMLSVPWAEDLDDEQPFDLNASYAGGTSLSLRIKVRWDDLPVAIQEILGYSRRGSDTLNRIPPWRCPVANVAGVAFHHLRASQISGMSVLGYGWNPTTAKYEVPAEIPKNSPNMSRWQHVKLTVVFTAPRYAILADDEIDGDETVRYLNHREESYTEFMKVKGAWLYAEACGAAPPATKWPPRTASRDFRCSARRCSWNGTSSRITSSTTTTGGPPTWRPATGSTTPPNSSATRPAHFFASQPRSLRNRRRSVPCSTAWQSLTRQSPIELSLTFKFFDPKLSPGATTRGWNLLPDKHDGAGGWALVRLNGRFWPDPVTKAPTSTRSSILSRCEPRRAPCARATPAPGELFAAGRRRPQ